jgi:RNA-directed DNA polymerase
VLVHGTQADAQSLREEVARVLASMGLRLSPAKTQIVHMSEAFDFLGFHIQWKRQRGSAQWHVYTFIAGRPIRSLKAKIRALTYRNSQQNPTSVLIRLNQIMRGWANYFRHAVCKHTLGKLANFAWWRVIRWLRTLHHWRWKDVRKAFTTPTGGGSRSRQAESNCSTWQRCRSPGTATEAARSPAGGYSTPPDGSNRGEPVALRGARRVRRAA